MKVGDKLWFVPGYRKAGAGYVTVEKVGRLYLTLSNRLRADKHTLYTDYSYCITLAKPLSRSGRRSRDLEQVPPFGQLQLHSLRIRFRGQRCSRLRG